MVSLAPKPARLRGWSLRIGRLAGIDVFVHMTFVLLLTWLAGSELFRSGSIRAAALALSFVLGVFGCVVLHELGHALVARRHGIATRDITLYPIGGVASLARFPSNPRHELHIAIAGPLVNLVLAALLSVLLLVVPAAGTFGEASLEGGALIPRLLIANVGLAAFNLLPAFPMDGGRVLRALLSRRQGRARATRNAARIGQAMALMFGVIGLLGAPMLVLLALFVWVAAEHEARSVEVEDALRGMTVSGAMETRFDVLRPGDPLALAESLILAGPQVDFPVVGADGSFAGILGREDVARGLGSGEGSVPVASLARQDLPHAAPGEPLRDALERLASTPWRTVPVLDERGHLVGLLSSENVAEIVMFHEATAHRMSGSRPRPT